jgi:hypothetical protein
MTKLTTGFLINNTLIKMVEIECMHQVYLLGSGRRKEVKGN